MNETYQAGEVVYVIIRNPHAQNVAQVQQAAVIESPDQPNELALFFLDNYYPLNEEFAIYKTEQDAEVAYENAFGTTEMEGFYG